MPQQINLINPALFRQRDRLSLKTALIGWLAVALMTGALAGYSGMRNRQLANELSAATAAVTQAQSQMQQLAGQVSGRKMDPGIAAEVARMESDVAVRDAAVAVLKSGSLGDTRGFSEHLSAFSRQSFEGVWLTGLHIAASGQDIALEGRALSAEHVPDYLRRLNTESVMQGHPFSELMMQVPASDPKDKSGAQAPYIEFRLTTRTEAATAKAVDQ